VVGFLSLVTCTYYLRSEVLALSHIRFSSDEVRAAYDLKQYRESFPDPKESNTTAGWLGDPSRRIPSLGFDVSGPTLSK
jgi:hypothetical protein